MMNNKDEFETGEEMQDACMKYADYIDEFGRPKTKTQERKVVQKLLNVGPKRADVVIVTIDALLAIDEKEELNRASIKTAECYYCGREFPDTDANFQIRTTQEESGRSSGAMRYTGFGSSGGWDDQTRKFKKIGGALSYSEGRTYYKTIKVRVCKHCLAKWAKNARIAKENSVRNWKIAAGVFAVWVAWVYFF